MNVGPSSSNNNDLSPSNFAPSNQNTGQTPGGTPAPVPTPTPPPAQPQPDKTTSSQANPAAVPPTASSSASGGSINNDDQTIAINTTPKSDEKADEDIGVGRPNIGVELEKEDEAQPPIDKPTAQVEEAAKAEEETPAEVDAVNTDNVDQKLDS